MNKIALLIATHKKYWLPSNPLYFPIHVGAEGKDPLGLIGDNTGNNISKKNPDYCELTGLYWAWKNIKTDYIGLCHYRRYFDFLRSDDFFLEHEELNPNNTQEIEKHIQISSENLIKYFTDGYDIILPKASYLRISFSGQYKRDHELADLHLAAQTVNDLFPDYKKSIDIILKGHKIFFKNMFICNWVLFDNYMSWLFPILDEIETRKTKLQLPYYPRLYGFLSERLFTLYIYQQHLKVKEIPLLTLNESIKNPYKKILSPRAILARWGLLNWY